MSEKNQMIGGKEHEQRYSGRSRTSDYFISDAHEKYKENPVLGHIQHTIGISERYPKNY